MKIKLWYYNFWNDFSGEELLERSFIKMLKEDGYEFVLDEKNPDIVFIGQFGPIIYNGQAIKIGYVSEDMNRFTGIFRKIEERNYFDFVIGSISPIKSSKFCKHPMYIETTSYRNPSKDIMVSVNNKVKTKDPLKLKFCAIIASHDMYGNRMPVVNILSKIKSIECPGKLNNNVKSFDDDGLTKAQYLENFLFTICPENHEGHEGYTSEKIRDAITSGCIPIYFGRTNDEQDSRIFNQNRIIRYDPSSDKSMNDCFNLVKKLMGNPDKLKDFYQQPPYLENADQVIEEMYDDLKKKFKKLLKKKNLLN
jgi:alpha(1,3/1,4) fucosyltransferase